MRVQKDARSKKEVYDLSVSTFSAKTLLTNWCGDQRNKRQRRDTVDVTELRTPVFFQDPEVEGVAFHIGCNHGSQEIMLCESKGQVLLMRQALESVGFRTILGRERVATNGDKKRTFTAFPINVTPDSRRNGTIVVNCHDPIVAMALEVLVRQQKVHFASFDVLPIKDSKRSTGGRRSSSHR